MGRGEEEKREDRLARETKDGSTATMPGLANHDDNDGTRKSKKARVSSDNCPATSGEEPDAGPARIGNPSREPIRTAFGAVCDLSKAMDRSAASEFRLAVRNLRHASHTSGEGGDHVQANMVALPKEHALDFLLFCLRNPRSCPLLDVLDPGTTAPLGVAPTGNVCSDIPRYRVYRGGELEVSGGGGATDVGPLWRDDMVTFLLGCSFTWEGLLQQAGLTPRHIEEGKNVPMYRTNVPNAPSGVFRGNLVVSMRPYDPSLVPDVTRITSQFPGAHGGPLHAGDADSARERFGIEASRIGSPDFGDAVTVRPGEVLVFWACGVTPQTAIAEAKLPLVITHSPGCMFVTDLLVQEIREGGG